MKILTIAAMVEAQGSIGFPAAATEVPDHSIPSTAVEGTNHTEDVRAGGIALQSMGNKSKTCCACK